MKEKITTIKNHSDTKQEDLWNVPEVYLPAFSNSPERKALFENSLIATFLSKNDGTIISANKAACDLFGYSEEEFLQIGRQGFIDHTDKNLAASLKERSANGFSRGELIAIKKNGERFIVEYSSALFQKMGGEEYCYSMLIDISEHKKNEAAIKASNERFELIGRAANDAVWEQNVVTNELWANLIHQQLYGLTLADAVPDNDEWVSRLHPSERDLIVKGFQNSLDSDTNIWSAEYRFRSSNKGWLNIFSRAYIERSKEGKVVRLIGSMMDITKQKQEESHLKLLESVITNTKDSILITEAEPFDEPGPKIVFVNEAFTAMTGYTSADVVGKTPRILQGPKTDKAELKKLSDALRKWESCDITVINYKKNGEEFWINMSISPVADETGWFTHWISIERDVTDRIESEIKLKELNADLQKQAKLLEASNAELEQFAYVASHDLQEPLRMVTGFLSQLEKKYGQVIDATGQKYIFYAVDGANRMRQIILDLLEFSRIGKAADKEELIDLNVLVHEIEMLLRKKIEDKKATILIDPLPVIRSGKVPIRQVFQNLIGNALKYSTDGIPAKIEIKVREMNDHWEFAISDNGIGISKEYFDKIFVIFQRLHNREAFSGTGIGLAVTKKVIEKKGGKIWVESELGKGSTFFFTIKKHI